MGRYGLRRQTPSHAGAGTTILSARVATGRDNAHAPWTDLTYAEDVRLDHVHACPAKRDERRSRVTQPLRQPRSSPRQRGPTQALFKRPSATLDVNSFVGRLPASSASQARMISNARASPTHDRRQPRLRGRWGSPWRLRRSPLHRPLPPAFLDRPPSSFGAYILSRIGLAERTRSCLRQLCHAYPFAPQSRPVWPQQ